MVSRGTNSNSLPLLVTFLMFGLLLMPFNAGSAPAEKQAVSLEQGKVILIRKILGHVRWPNDRALETLVLGYYGDDPAMFQAIFKSLSNTKIRGKRIRVIQLRKMNAASSVEVLIVDVKYNTRMAALARMTKGSGTLMISDQVIDKHHVMINFVLPADNRLSFEINRSSLLVEGFVLSKDITLYGGTELDGAELYKETEAELAEALKLAESQKSSILEQQAELAKQAEIISRQGSNISEQLATINRQGSRIAERERVLQVLENNMDEIRLALDGKSQSLRENEDVLSSQRLEIDSYANRIDQNVDRLSRQTSRLEAQEKLITEKNDQLTLHINTIADQRLILIVAVAVLFVVFLLVALLFRANREKNRMNIRLELMAEARGRFLSTMSHEIRTPLNGVLGILDLLRDTLLDKKQKYYLDTMHASGDLLISVINDILDFSKIDAGKMPIERVSFSLHQLFQDCVMIFNLQDHPEVEFEFVIEPDVPSQIWGDPTRLRQILLNLLSNAFKFTDKGLVRVELALSGDRSKFTLCVRDTGIGITAAQREGLFSAFGQADKSITRRFGGTGLGLAICGKLVSLMAGTIRVASVEGEGSVFTIELPLEPVESAKAIAEISNDRLKLAVKESRSAKPLFPNHRVLLVEDNPTNQLVALGMLKRFGIVPDVADNGVEALELYQAAYKTNSNTYDLILMDCEMPIMDGFTATKAIRSSELENTRDAVVIVALTAHAMSEHRDLGRTAGMNEHLTKPLKSDALQAVLSQFLS